MLVTMGHGVAGHERIQSHFHLFETREVVQPVAAGADFSDSLRPSKHQDAHDPDGRPGQVHCFIKYVAIFADARFGPIHQVNQFPFAQAIRCISNRGFIEVHDGVPIR